MLNRYIKVQDGLQRLNRYINIFAGLGGECVTPVLVRSLKLNTLGHSQ